MNNMQEERLFPAPENILVDIHHPTFLQGYQTGRKWYVEDSEPLTDKQVVELLEKLFRENASKDAKTPSDHIYFYTGQLLGKISGSLIPRQPQEEEPLYMQQERFLARVVRDYGVQGPHLAESIQQLWAVHDHIAQTLDADDFDQMLRRGLEKRAIL